MTPPPRVLAVVPARGGSKGLPGKNVRSLAGLPLIGHSMRAAAMIPTVTRCIVSTDSPEIAAVARDLGGDVPFLRPGELAADDTPMAPVLRHALATVEEQEGGRYDFLVLLDPTSPARQPSWITDAVTLLGDRSSWDGVVTVSAPHFHPVWVGVHGAADEPDRMERYFAAGAGVTRRQELDRYLRVNGALYVWRTEFVRRLQSSWMDEGVHGMLEIPESQAFAIDYLDEFSALEALVAQGVVNLPWL